MPEINSLQIKKFHSETSKDVFKWFSVWLEITGSNLMFCRIFLGQVMELSTKQVGLTINLFVSIGLWDTKMNTRFEFPSIFFAENGWQPWKFKKSTAGSLGLARMKHYRILQHATTCLHYYLKSCEILKKSRTTW